MPLADLFLPYIWGGSASRAFAEWQRETTLPESDLYSMGWVRVKVGLRVLSVSAPPSPVSEAIQFELYLRARLGAKPYHGHVTINSSFSGRFLESKLLGKSE